jgi:hypothetical protein
MEVESFDSNHPEKVPAYIKTCPVAMDRSTQSPPLAWQKQCPIITGQNNTPKTISPHASPHYQELFL